MHHDGQHMLHQLLITSSPPTTLTHLLSTIDCSLSYINHVSPMLQQSFTMISTHASLVLLHHQHHTHTHTHTSSYHRCCCCRLVVLLLLFCYLFVCLQRRSSMWCTHAFFIFLSTHQSIYQPSRCHYMTSYTRNNDVCASGRVSLPLTSIRPPVSSSHWVVSYLSRLIIELSQVQAVLSLCRLNFESVCQKLTLCCQ